MSPLGICADPEAAVRAAAARQPLFVRVLQGDRVTDRVHVAGRYAPKCQITATGMAGGGGRQTMRRRLTQTRTDSDRTGCAMRLGRRHESRWVADSRGRDRWVAVLFQSHPCGDHHVIARIVAAGTHPAINPASNGRRRPQILKGKWRLRLPFRAAQAALSTWPSEWEGSRGCGGRPERLRRPLQLPHSCRRSTLHPAHNLRSR